MGKSSAPSAPNPYLTAAAQTGSNVSTAAANAALGNVNQYTPYGSTTYQQTGSYTTPSGEVVPAYSQFTQLSPLGQQTLTGEQNVAANLTVPTAQEYADSAKALADVTGGKLNLNTPFTSTLNQGPQLLDQNVTNALYGEQKGFLDPQWNLQGQQLQDQLSRQGIPVGSEAYNNALQQFNNSKTQAYQAAQDQAIAGGSSAASNLFNMALSGQGQNIAQQQAALQEPIQLLGQLFGSGPQTQSQPIVQPTSAQMANTDFIGAQGLSTQAQQQAYQAQLASQNSTFGGLASLGGAALMALALA